jgi:chromosome segregation ATPase
MLSSVYACSERARCNNSELPSFTGPQVLQRLSELEHTIAQIRQERNRLRDVEAQALAQWNDAQDAARDAALKLDELKAARKHLNDLLTIAHERFPPPPSPV